MQKTEEIKLCMGCDEGRSNKRGPKSPGWGSTDRRCKLCTSLSCVACMPEGNNICNHCKQYRVEAAQQSR